MEVGRWIEADESAEEMLSRVLTERPPFFLLPPLHRFPWRVGNVLEIVGPSASAKTLILIQAAISCILPKEWNGVQYGGLGRSVMYIDLDCRFDVSCLAEFLKNRIREANGQQRNGDLQNHEVKRQHGIGYDGELFAECMNRFFYVRGYNSSEFLAILKTLHYQLKVEKEAHGMCVHFLMIDSIGAFNWIDRASRPLASRCNNRKTLSLQGILEAVVQEIKKLQHVHPIVVIATKAIATMDTNSANEVKWNSRKWFVPDSSRSENVKSDSQHIYSDYMPSVWRSFVSHRVLVRPAGDTSTEWRNSVYLSEWLLPQLNFSDKFALGDAGGMILL